MADKTEKNPNVGVWVTAELDDEGKLVVELHGAKEWTKDETVHCAEDVTDKLPDNVKKSITSALQSVITAGTESIMQLAAKDAITHANFAAGKTPPQTLQMKFDGEMKSKGKAVS